MESTQRLELKIIALKEGFRSKVSSLLDEYEERVAELRIDLTEQSQENERLTQENQNLQNLINNLQENISKLESEREPLVQEEAADAADSTEDSDKSN